MTGVAPGSVTALVLAAGDGSRMGITRPKVLAELAGKSILEWSVAAFEASPLVDTVVVVAPAAYADEIATLLKAGPGGTVVVVGGTTRSASTLAGLQAIGGEGHVLVHDAARPLVTVETISAVVIALAEKDAVTVATPATDTMLMVDGEAVVEIPDRVTLWHAQTPQGFRLATLRAAYAAAGAKTPDFTDDCSIVRRLLPDVQIGIVTSSPENVKITRPGDIAVAESLLAARAARSKVPYSE